uniref:Variant surface glycoprotein 1125.4762 n=1 Tax=Trypanosoma brucei TaxID=5691 RepID=A0A1J0RB28_9TRYP|nr:variant surface glycoprotein 1125.4762 [Trypanosoma brucei]
MKLLFLALACVHYTARQAQQAAGDGLDKGAWSKFCTISEELNKVQGNAAERLQAFNTIRVKNKQTQLRLQIYATEAQDDTARTKAATLALWLSRKADAAATAGLTTASKKAINGVAAALYAKGRVDELLELMAQTKSGSHGCLVNGNSGSGDPVAKNNGKIGDTEYSLTRKTPAATYSELTILTPQGFAEEPLPTAAGSTKQTSTKACNFLTLNAAGFWKTGQQDAATIYYGGGIFSGAKSDSQLTGAKLTTLATKHDANARTWKDAATGANEIKNVNSAEYDNTSLTAEADNDLKAAVAYIALNKETKAEGETTPQLDQLFSKPLNTAISKFIEEVEAHEITSGALEMKAATPLGKINDVQKLTALLLRATIASTKEKIDLATELKNRATSQQKKSTDEKEKECNTKGRDKQEECEKLESQGCVFNKDGKDGEKCTLSEAGKNKQQENKQKQKEQSKLGV